MLPIDVVALTDQQLLVPVLEAVAAGQAINSTAHLL
jgi:hypothetical protein